VLRGAAVSVLGEGPAGPLVEMAGAAAEYCPFAKLCHVVVIPHARPDLPRHVALNARSNAGVKTAVYLARCSLGKPASETEVYESEWPLEPRADGRPLIAYIGQVTRASVAEVDEQIIYGHNTTGMVPMLMHPNEWLDGAFSRATPAATSDVFLPEPLRSSAGCIAGTSKENPSSGRSRRWRVRTTSTVS
jgi:glycine reductase